MPRNRKRDRVPDDDYDPSSDPDCELEKEERHQQRRSNNAVAKQPLSTASFRGVTHHIRTNRYEAHLWENGKQLYLGGHDTPELAALAFDLASLRYRGAKADTNFDIGWFTPFLPSLTAVPPETIVAGLRRHSKGSSTQSSLYKGVTRHQKGRWEARIGQTAGKKYQYLGLHDDEIQGAKAYDGASIERNGVEAATNFHLSTYMDELSEEQLAKAREKGLITDSDVALELALRSAAEGNDVSAAIAEIVAAAPSELQMPPMEHLAPAAALPAAAEPFQSGGYEMQAGVAAPLVTRPLTPPSWPHLDPGAIARRGTTCSTEDALAGQLYGAITQGAVEDYPNCFSPQSVLPPRFVAAAAQDQEVPVSGEVPVPPLTKLSAEALGCVQDFGIEGGMDVDLSLQALGLGSPPSADFNFGRVDADQQQQLF